MAFCLLYPPLPPMGPTTKRVLIVEDEPHVRALLRECFRHFDHGHTYEVETAANGGDGVMALLRRRPDLLLLDLHMPVLDGLQVLRQLRELAVSVPVLMITATHDSRAVAEALTYGIFAYVPKPVDVHRLEHLVALAVPTPRRVAMRRPG